MTLFLLAAITTTIVYLVHVLKRKILSTTVGDESSTSVERSPPHETIVTITNPAYKLVQRQRATVTANRELEQVTRDPSTIGVEESTAIDTEPQESNDESQDSELKMEKNVAYQSSTTTQNNLIPLHLNMAYRYESRKAFNVNHHADDEEDYI